MNDTTSDKTKLSWWRRLSSGLKRTSSSLGTAVADLCRGDKAALPREVRDQASRRRREVCGGDFEGQIVRSPYGITHSLPFVDDKVKLLIEVEAIRQ